MLDEENKYYIQDQTANVNVNVNEELQSMITYNLPWKYLMVHHILHIKVQEFIYYHGVSYIIYKVNFKILYMPHISILSEI